MMKGGRSPVGTEHLRRDLLEDAFLQFEWQVRHREEGLLDEENYCSSALTMNVQKIAFTMVVIHERVNS